MLELSTYAAAAGFLDHTGALFRSDEVRHGLIYGIAERLRRTPEVFPAPPYLATVEDDGQLAAAALMTPPHNLLVVANTDTPARAFALIAQNLRAAGWPVPGVNGVSAAAHSFADVWRELTGETATVRMGLRVFELRQVQPPSNVPGAMRPAGDADLELVLSWFRDFQVEANVNDPPPQVEHILRRIQERGIYLWDDGGPVSLAGKGRQTAHGVSIGPVFTPVALRGRGYASACVAALSQLILDEGWAFCTLFTDLANPTSNKIYQQVGYRPVCDFNEIRFTAPA